MPSELQTAFPASQLQRERTQTVIPAQAVIYSGLTKIRTRRRSRRQYKQYGTDSLGASAP
ncbi:hypothetical protein [Neisseria bergeri]|uniref:hypothetical protein n=1 Tax=Neisseria bergeri TaxID=1906581 RepID=UPI00272A7580|nr:hypothetical protein [Neisseria bergeri]